MSVQDYLKGDEVLFKNLRNIFNFDCSVESLSTKTFRHLGITNTKICDNSKAQGNSLSQLQLVLFRKFGICIFHTTMCTES
jgi:hypothetical protein